MKRSLVPILLALTIVGCRPSADDAVAAAVESMEASVLAAMARKDPAPIIELFADDAVLHSPNGTTVTGKQAIAERIVAQFPRIKGYQIGARDLEVGGDLAYGHTTFKLTLDPGPTGGHQDLLGSMVVVLKRQADGAWKLLDVGSWIAEADEMDHDMPGMPM